MPKSGLSRLAPNMSCNSVTEGKLRSSCDACLNTKVKCSQTKPSCTRCIRHGYSCVYSRYRKIGRPSLKARPHAEQRLRELVEQPLRQQQTPRTESAATEGQQVGQLQTRQFPTLVQHQHGQQPAEQDHVHDDPACIHVRVDNGSAPDTPDPAETRSLPSRSSHSPRPSFLEQRLNANPSASLAEAIADKGSTLDDDLSTMDWAELDKVLGLPAVPSEEPRFGDIFSSSTMCVDSPPHSSAMVPTSTVSFSPSPVTSSYDDGWELEPRHVMPSYPSINCHSAVLGQCLFRSRPESYILGSKNATPVTSEPCSAERSHGPSRSSSSSGSTHLSQANLFFSRESTHQHVTESRCVLQCHVDLTNQLASISRCQGHDNAAALDMLLKLDNRIREAREKTLDCPICMGKERCGQTLMLLTMVASNLLGLFESSCGRGTRRTGSNNNNKSRSSSSSSSKNGSHGDIWWDAVFSASPSANSSLSADTDGAGPFRGLPYTSRPLTVGDVQLSDEVKQAFSRRMLKMYLGQQIDTFGQLSQMLAAAEPEDVNRKIAQDLLEDASNRAERLVGYVALTDEVG